MEFFVASILQKFGITEDGEDYIGETYFVAAIDEDGNRWNHYHSFPGVKIHDDEDYRYYEDVREDAKAAATKLMERIKAAGTMDDRYWVSDRPVYGSKAYIAYGQADDYMQELMEDF